MDKQKDLPTEQKGGLMAIPHCTLTYLETDQIVGVVLQISTTILRTRNRRCPTVTPPRNRDTTKTFLISFSNRSATGTKQLLID